MNRRRWFLLGGLFIASTALAQEQPKSIELKEVPKPVQRAVQLWMAGGSLDSIDQVQEEGRVTYEVEFTSKEGKDRDFTVMANGTLLSLEIALADAPGPVQKTLKNEAGTDTLDSIEKNFDTEEPTFDISFVTNDGQDRDFTLDGNGKVISQTVALADTPVAMQRAIQTQAGSNTIEDIEEVFDEDNTITYQVALTLKDGASRSFTLDGSDGQLESMEIGLAEAPAAVQKTVVGEMGAGQFESIDKVYDLDGIIYEAAYYTKAGRERHFTVSADGKLASREVALTDTPAPVQATIKQQIGDGKILGIDHTFTEKTAGVFPFEIQAEKDGKAFDFSVGPKGRFLGMDD
jgi:uncharacterized membrane protein YkoI